MGLKHHHQPAIRPARPERFNSRRDFRRMVAVVIYEGDLSSRYREIALHIKSPSNTRKIPDSLNNGLIADTFIGSNGHGCRRVERIMATRHGKSDFERPLAFRTCHLKLYLAGFLLKFGNTIIGFFREAIGENWTRQLSNNAFYTGVINTKDGEPVKRQIMQKLYEIVFEVLKVTTVGDHVVSFDIRDRSHHGLQVHE